ncbi:hypothetical protein OQH61_01170 [Helicobacter sp. MIT 21-1697]|nr:hypothetical protein [Helicobacter sp. MIT 21-1697]MCX2716351.1 hypothetical protein [Helicobacter sp. MIT 21-1697]
MDGLKIEKYNLAFKISYSNGENGYCYVPQPNEIELKSLSKILG